jgi:NAD+ synthase
MLLDRIKLGDRAPAEIDRICAWLRETVLGTLRRRGVVLGLSGGIDSSVVAARRKQE